MNAVLIETVEQRALLTQAMATDPKHDCYRPTHLLVDDRGAIRGAFSTTAAPVLFFWIHSSEGNPLVSLRGYRLAEAEFRRLGHRAIFLPIQTLSPFHEFVKKLGYTMLCGCELHEKRFH